MELTLKIEFVEAFLRKFNEITENYNGIIVVPREKNKQCLLDLELTATAREEIILKLNYKNYCKGPEADRDMPGEVWFFGKEVNGKEIYIKLKLKDDEKGGLIPLCLGFHEAESPLYYPLS